MPPPPPLGREASERSAGRSAGEPDAESYEREYDGVGAGRVGGSGWVNGCNRCVIFRSLSGLLGSAETGGKCPEGEVIDWTGGSS